MSHQQYPAALSVLTQSGARYIVAILSLVIIGYLQLLAAWALFALRRVNHFAIIYLLVVTLIIVSLIFLIPTRSS